MSQLQVVRGTTNIEDGRVGYSGSRPIPDRSARSRVGGTLRTAGESVPAEGRRDEKTVAPSSALLPDAFKAAFRRHPAGVAIITADSITGPVGLTATSVISVSAEPPLLVFSLSAASSATPAISAAETIMIHLLPAGELAAAQRFATSGIDRFADASMWMRAPTGEPVLRGDATRIRGQVVSRMTAGRSIVVAVQALEISVRPETAEPLVYFDRSWHTLGEASQLP